MDSLKCHRRNKTQHIFQNICGRKTAKSMLLYGWWLGSSAWDVISVTLFFFSLTHRYFVKFVNPSSWIPMANQSSTFSKMAHNIGSCAFFFFIFFFVFFFLLRFHDIRITNEDVVIMVSTITSCYLKGKQ